MKTIAFVCLLTLLSFRGWSQSMPTKIYLVRNGVRSLWTLQFYTTLSTNQPITIKNNGYSLIETDADSLGITNEKSYLDTDASYQSSMAKQKPVFIKLEKGKSYYFKVGPVAYSQYIDVDEMTERAFKLYIGLNNLGDTVKKYVLSNSDGLVKSQE